MTAARWCGTLLALLLGGCAAKVPPPPASVRTVAVFPVLNQTGDPLLIGGGSVLEKYVFHSERFGVCDVLAAEARTLLAERGYGVVSPEAVAAAVGDQPPDSRYAAAMVAKDKKWPGAVMYIELLRWAYGSPDAIIVSLRVDLVDADSGRLLWSNDREARPVQTQGTIDITQAYFVAARTVMRDALAPFPDLTSGAESSP